MTQLRKIMLEELQRRNYSQTTVKSYLRIVEAFAKHYQRPPDQLGSDEIRAYQAYLFTSASSARVPYRCTPPPCDFSTAKH